MLRPYHLESTPSRPIGEVVRLGSISTRLSDRPGTSSAVVFSHSFKFVHVFMPVHPALLWFKQMMCLHASASSNTLGVP